MEYICKAISRNFSQIKHKANKSISRIFFSKNKDLIFFFKLTPMILSFGPPNNPDIMADKFLNLDHFMDSIWNFCFSILAIISSFSSALIARCLLSYFGLFSPTQKLSIRRGFWLSLGIWSFAKIQLQISRIAKQFFLI